jgi:hypothetical protein
MCQTILNTDECRYCGQGATVYASSPQAIHELAKFTVRIKRILTFLGVCSKY